VGTFRRTYKKIHMKRIKLTQEKVALVDDADFEFLNQWKWFYHQTGYAKSCHRYMHRLINKTPKGFHTDHINRNKLDNRKSNLRYCMLLSVELLLLIVLLRGY